MAFHSLLISTEPTSHHPFVPTTPSVRMIHDITQWANQKWERKRAAVEKKAGAEMAARCSYIRGNDDDDNDDKKKSWKWDYVPCYRFLIHNWIRVSRGERMRYYIFLYILLCYEKKMFNTSFEKSVWLTRALN